LLFAAAAASAVVIVCIDIVTLHFSCAGCCVYDDVKATLVGIKKCVRIIIQARDEKLDFCN